MMKVEFVVESKRNVRDKQKVRVELKGDKKLLQEIQHDIEMFSEIDPEQYGLPGEITIR